MVLSSVRRVSVLLVIASVASALAACAAGQPPRAASPSAPPEPRAAHPAAAPLYQHSVFSVFAAGDYDGNISMSDLLHHGDFGLGAADGLDGELIVLDGQAYGARAGGAARLLAGSYKTPWAEVTFFGAARNGIAFEHAAPSGEVEAAVDAAYPANRSLAIKVTGTFRTLKVRAIPGPSKPYPPLTAVVPTQVVIDLPGAATMVGFRLPSCVKGWNVPGYHFHALGADRAKGGHVLSYEVERASVEVSPIESFDVPVDGSSAGPEDANCPRSQGTP
jgi:acetolactate decarboxylase